MTTIKDIARHAGVSVTTVSRALNGYSDVNEKTREKIIRIAKELNYSPNTLARGLVMNKSKTIGLLVSGLDRSNIKDNFTFQILAGVNECVSNRDYDIVLFNTTSTKQREKTYSQLCRERRVDGVILSGIKIDDPYLKEVVESDIPCVLVDIPIKSETVGYVTTNNILGAHKAVTYLIEQGHKNIAFINGHDQAFVSKQRLKGYLQSLDEANITVKEEWILNGEFSEDVARIKALELLQEYRDITAIFCASDLMALGVLRAAKELSIEVPTQLSIIGYDDILLASYSTPTLSTIAQDIIELGYQGANLLIDMLEGKADTRVCVLNTKMLIRESTSRPQINSQ